MVFTLKICSHRHTNSHTYIHTLIRTHTLTLSQVNETQVRTQIKLTLLLATCSYTHTHIHTLQTSTIHSHIQYMQLGQVFAYKHTHTHTHFQVANYRHPVSYILHTVHKSLFMYTISYNILQHPALVLPTNTYPIVLLCTQTSTHTYSSWDSADDLGYIVDDNLCIMYSVYCV